MPYYIYFPFTFLVELMKRKLPTIAIIVLLIAGCRTTPTRRYVIPEDLKVRMDRVTAEVEDCIAGKDDIRFYVSSSSVFNAWIYDNRVYVTEVLLRKVDDDALKFLLSHEIAHNKLGHIQKQKAVSYVTTGVMVVVGMFVPGAGYLNYAINPAVVNNFSKLQEYDADEEAAKACGCLGIDPVAAIESFRMFFKEGGDFWDRHPSWEDRIENIKK